MLEPVAEPEIAVHLGRDIAAGSDRETAVAAIAGRFVDVRLDQ